MNKCGRWGSGRGSKGVSAEAIERLDFGGGGGRVDHVKVGPEAESQKRAIPISKSQEKAPGLIPSLLDSR